MQTTATEHITASLQETARAAFVDDFCRRFCGDAFSDFSRCTERIRASLQKSKTLMKIKKFPKKIKNCKLLRKKRK